MADDKTEAPTPRRAQEARGRGQVARSVELNTAVAMVVSILLLRSFGPGVVQSVQTILLSYINQLAHVDVTDAWLRQTTFNSLLTVLPSVLFIMVGMLAAGVITTMGQTGFLWSFKGFDFSRVNPINGFKRLFSTHGLIELLRSTLKLGLVGWIAYSNIQGDFPRLLVLNQMDMPSALSVFFELATSLGLAIGEAYFILAAADYTYQRWELNKNLRMTKQEIKEEYKSSEGDPAIKQRIRQQARRMARNRMMANVPKASVIVTNPTHIALAIQYDPSLSAPVLLAKGAHLVAQRIVALARSEGIPVVENRPLAWAIYRTVELDQPITPDLYRATAEVLAYVYRISGKTPRTQAAQPQAQPAQQISHQPISQES